MNQALRHSSRQIRIGSLMHNDVAILSRDEIEPKPDRRVGDTIFAMASGAGRAAVAVMRLSGPDSRAALQMLAGDPPPPRRASLRQLRNAAGELLDEALVLWMPGPASYTGEDSVEFHLHAGPAVIEGVALALVAAEARPAEAGEFTRRAFLNGRIELTAAEAIADLVAAETQAQRSQALQQMGGALSRLFDGWATRLRRLLARQEALIDFPEEADSSATDASELASLLGELEAQLADDHRGERLRTGLTVVVSGPPNVGKSSLVNALSGLDAAIVSPHPGTTRDIIEVRTVFGGVPVTLIDTAGLHDSTDPVEMEGIRRARARASQADLVLSVTEAGTTPQTIGQVENTLYISSKIDLAPPSAGRLGVSVWSGLGLPELRAALTNEARRLAASVGPAPLTRARHRAACVRAAFHLHSAIVAPAVELRAEELRLAMLSLGRVTGRVGVEDILDDVFSQFCIGK